jgi:hypothetical protein
VHKKHHRSGVFVTDCNPERSRETGAFARGNRVTSRRARCAPIHLTPKGAEPRLRTVPILPTSTSPPLVILRLFPVRNTRGSCDWDNEHCPYSPIATCILNTHRVAIQIEPNTPSMAESSSPMFSLKAKSNPTAKRIAPSQQIIAFNGHRLLSLSASLNLSNGHKEGQCATGSIGVFAQLPINSSRKLLGQLTFRPHGCDRKRPPGCDAGAAR